MAELRWLLLQYFITCSLIIPCPTPRLEDANTGPSDTPTPFVHLCMREYIRMCTFGGSIRYFLRVIFWLFSIGNQ